MAGAAAVRIGAQFHRGMVGACVARHVRQAFLHQAVDGDGRAVVEPAGMACDA
jgi:hypothetical protein